VPPRACLGGTFAFVGFVRNSKHVKWLAKFGSKFAVLPSGVRKHEIQQATFLARFLFYGQFVHPPREVEQSDVVLNLVKFGGLVVCDR
jgi:hypothetical protein